EFLQDSGRQSLLFEEVIEFPHRQAQLIRDGAKRQFPPLIASVQMTQYLLIATFDKVTNHGSLGGMLPCYDAANVFCDAVINYCVDADGHLYITPSSRRNECSTRPVSIRVLISTASG